MQCETSFISVASSHKLGHNLGFDHPFEEFGIPKANTLNFMDYNPNANMFWFWQWVIINPNFNK